MDVAFRIRIVELGQIWLPPFAAEILADLGAEVIKVEKPGGDDARQWGPPFWDGDAALFHQMNSNKKSVVLGRQGIPDIRKLLELIGSRMSSWTICGRVQFKILVLNQAYYSAFLNSCMPTSAHSDT